MCVRKESSLIVSELIRGVVTGEERAGQSRADEGVETGGASKEIGYARGTISGLFPVFFSRDVDTFLGGRSRFGVNAFPMTNRT